MACASIALLSCAAPKPPPVAVAPAAIVPPEVAPKRVKHAPQAVQPVRIVWDYPTNMPDVRFELWGATTPKGPFHLTAVVDQSPAVLEHEGFFMLRASNSVTHLVSDWASAAP